MINNQRNICRVLEFKVSPPNLLQRNQLRSDEGTAKVVVAEAEAKFHLDSILVAQNSFFKLLDPQRPTYPEISQPLLFQAVQLCARS